MYVHYLNSKKVYTRAKRMSDKQKNIVIKT